MTEIKTIDWQRTAVNVVSCPKDTCMATVGERCVVRGTDKSTPTHTPRCKQAQELHAKSPLKEDQLFYTYYYDHRADEEAEERQLDASMVAGALKLAYRILGHDEFFVRLAQNVEWSMVEKMVPPSEFH